jgi:hypothetical protein
MVAGGSDAGSNQDFTLARHHAITGNGVEANRVDTAGNDILLSRQW